MSTIAALPTALPLDLHADQHRPSRTKLYLLISLMTFIWSLNYIVVKSVAPYFPLITLAALRTVVAGLCVLLVYL